MLLVMFLGGALLFTGSVIWIVIKEERSRR